MEMEMNDQRHLGYELLVDENNASDNSLIEEHDNVTSQPSLQVNPCDLVVLPVVRLDLYCPIALQLDNSLVKANNELKIWPTLVFKEGNGQFEITGGWVKMIKPYFDQVNTGGGFMYLCLLKKRTFLELEWNPKETEFVPCMLNEKTKLYRMTTPQAHAKNYCFFFTPKHIRLDVIVANMWVTLDKKIVASWDMKKCVLQLVLK